jgi:hypothetical protein
MASSARLSMAVVPTVTSPIDIMPSLSIGWSLPETN